MSEREHDLTATVVTGAAVLAMTACILFVATILTMVFEEAFLLPVGALSAAVAIRYIVRRVNRRDDPRRDDRPPVRA